MSTIIIDRRLNGKDKSAENRKRFYQRYKPMIKKSAQDSLKDREIKDDSGHDVHIPKKSLRQYTFVTSPGTGKTVKVHPGNDRFARGDRIPKPPSGAGQGSGSGDPSKDGESEDDFIFNMSKEEYLNEIFDDLELPNMTMDDSDLITNWNFSPAGFSDQGVDSNINYRESYKKKTGRKIAMTGKYRRRLQEIDFILNAFDTSMDWPLETSEVEDGLTKYMLGDMYDICVHARTDLSVDELRNILINEAAGIKERISKIPSFVSNDLRYNLRTAKPEYSNKATMICLMDVSGSMDQSMKDLAKRFFILLYIFLKRNYDKIEVVFVRHHTSAKEVDEEEFFYSKESGGTIVHQALEFIRDEIIKKRFKNDKNIYLAQASDGDTWTGGGWGSGSDDDADQSAKVVRDDLFKYVRHMTYIEIANSPQNLWHRYEALTFKHSEQLHIHRIKEPADCIAALRAAYKKRSTES